MEYSFSSILVLVIEFVRLGLLTLHPEPHRVIESITQYRSNFSFLHYLIVWRCEGNLVLMQRDVNLYRYSTNMWSGRITMVLTTAYPMPNVLFIG